FHDTATTDIYTLSLHDALPIYLFFTSASENLCGVLAVQLVDNGKTSRYASARKDDAIHDFVATVMGLPPSDARAADMTTILTDQDRKSTRLNSSHVAISYAVFC